MNPHPSGQTRVVAFRGALDLSTAQEVGESLEVRGAGPTGHLVVDLLEAEFADSTGLSLLLNAARRRVTAGFYLIVVCRPGPILRLLELTALTQTLNVVGSLDAAHALIDAAAAGPFRKSGGGETA